MLKKSLFALFVIALVFPSFSSAWEGKVIGIKGCALIVFDGTNFPVTVFLREVDPTRTCPRGARQFVSDAVFGKEVEVRDEKKTEGGVVAGVMMKDGKSLGDELLKQDFMRRAAEMPASVSPRTETASPVSPASIGQPFRSSPKNVSSSSGRHRESSVAPGVRRWRDKDGNLHFSGTAGGE